VLKIGVARHATLNGAQTIADVQYAARLGSQLRQSVLSRAAISLGCGIDSTFRRKVTVTLFFPCQNAILQICQKLK